MPTSDGSPIESRDNSNIGQIQDLQKTDDHNLDHDQKAAGLMVPDECHPSEHIQVAVSIHMHVCIFHPCSISQ